MIPFISRKDLPVCSAFVVLLISTTLFGLVAQAPVCGLRVSDYSRAGYLVFPRAG